MYLDFENQEKGYKQFDPSRQNIKANIGKQICFVNKRSIDKYRGYYNVEYGVISGIRYSRLFMNNFEAEIDIRDIVECGIKIESQKQEQ